MANRETSFAFALPIVMLVNITYSVATTTIGADAFLSLQMYGFLSAALMFSSIVLMYFAPVLESGQANRNRI